MDRDQAQHDLDALTKLNATGAASASEVAAARQRLDVGQRRPGSGRRPVRKDRYSPAEVARAQSALADAEANLVAAQQVEDQTKVRAPAAGTVYSVDVQPTDFVEQGKLLLQLADLHHERVRAYFDEPEIGGLAVGQPIEIKWDARPGQIWHGHIERVPVTVIHLETRTVGEVLVDSRRPRWRTAARYQCDGHRDHLQPGQCPQHSPRSAAHRKRQIVRLQNRRMTS